MRCTAAILLLAGMLPGAVVVDRIAVIVGKHVIKASDIDQDLRVTEFLNRQPFDMTVQARRQSAERLIDQEIIRQEIINGGYERAKDSEAEALEKQLAHDRFEASQARLREALARYGLHEEELRSRLLWQLTVLRFIDERFRPGVFVSDDQVLAYSDQHQSELRKHNPKASYEALQSKIRNILEGEQINRNFDDWLKEARQRYRIEYKQEAFE